MEISKLRFSIHCRLFPFQTSPTLSVHGKSAVVFRLKPIRSRVKLPASRLWKRGDLKSFRTAASSICDHIVTVKALDFRAVAANKLYLNKEAFPWQAGS